MLPNKLSRATRISTTLMAAVMTLACGGASSDSGDGSDTAAAGGASAAAPILAMGETGTYKSFPAGPDMKKPIWTVTLDSVQRSESDAGMLLATVTLRAVADCQVQENISGCAYSGRHFNVALADGTKITGSTMGLPEDRSLQSGNFNVGDTVTGWVGFDVPAGTGKATLMYEPYPGQVAPQFGFEIDV